MAAENRSEEATPPCATSRTYVVSSPRLAAPMHSRRLTCCTVHIVLSKSIVQIVVWIKFQNLVALHSDPSKKKKDTHSAQLKMYFFFLDSYLTTVGNESYNNSMFVPELPRSFSWLFNYGHSAQWIDSVKVEMGARVLMCKSICLWLLQPCSSSSIHIVKSANICWLAVIAPAGGGQTQGHNSGWNLPFCRFFYVFFFFFINRWPRWKWCSSFFFTGFLQPGETV